MKTMMKKCGVFAALAVVLLVTAALVTGCPASAPESSGYKPPAGKGAVTLNFGYTDNRTVMPTGVTIANFVTFDLDFTVPVTPGVGTPQNITNVAYADREDPIDFDPGTYDLSVIGYLASGAAATFTQSGIALAAGSNTTLPITLKPYDPALETADGEFLYVINGIAAIASGSLDITSISGNGTVVTQIDIKSDPNNTGSPLPLTEGYYHIDLAATDAGGLTFSVQNILHIYRNMTSSFEYTIEAGQFILTNAKRTPSWTFDMGDKTPVLANSVAATTSITAITLSIATVGTTPVTLIVSNNGTPAPLINYGAIDWSYDGSSIGTGASLVINGSTTPLNKQGIYDVVVTGTVGGVDYDTTIRITLNL